MKKILILSLFFPPCNLTASQRSFSWAKYLHRYGFYPIVVTRRWDHHLKSLQDVSKDTEQEILHEKNKHYEVFYLPYRGNLRDRIYVKYGNDKLSFLRRLLTFGELVLQNFFISVIPYKNIYEFSRKLLKTDKEIKVMVVTGNPFNMFKMAFLLNKEFNIKWVADYRDAWTTTEIKDKKGFLNNFVENLDRYFEKKWVGTASYITASSRPIAEGVSKFIGVRGGELYNGFISSDFENISGNEKFEKFTISYIGTLYEGQKIEMFVSAFKRFIDKNPNAKTLLLFPGLSFYVEQEKRVKNLLKGYESFFECTPRIEREKVLEIERKSHLLLHVAWNEQKGIIASKIYEYIASGTRILVVPSDSSSIEEIVETSKAGVCLSYVEEVEEFIEQEYADFLLSQIKKNNVESQEIQLFSREKQVERLAEILNTI